jgi:hypothetical protein
MVIWAANTSGWEWVKETTTSKWLCFAHSRGVGGVNGHGLAAAPVLEAVEVLHGTVE